MAIKAPQSPQRGGLCGRALKSMKFHPVKSIGKQTLTFEELGTLDNDSHIYCVINEKLKTRQFDIKCIFFQEN